MKYVIDFTRKNLTIECYFKEDIQIDLKFYKKKNVSELDDHDFRIFDTKRDAERFLLEYKKILQSLDNSKICKTRDCTYMLYKRKYLVQSLMKKKMSTTRHYFKDLKKGDLLNLHDQTFFLTVRIKSVEKLPTNEYRYNFELL